MQNRTKGPKFQEVLVQDSEEFCNGQSCPTARDVDSRARQTWVASYLCCFLLSDLEPEINLLLPKLSLSHLKE